MARKFLKQKLWKYPLILYIHCNKAQIVNMHNCSLRNHMHPEHFDLGKILQSYLNTVQDYFIYITSPCTIVMFPLTNFLFYPFFIRFSLSLSWWRGETSYGVGDKGIQELDTSVANSFDCPWACHISWCPVFLLHSYTVVSNNLTFRVQVKRRGKHKTIKASSCEKNSCCRAVVVHVKEIFFLQILIIRIQTLL